jgi:hypothetical protein
MIPRWFSVNRASASGLDLLYPQVPRHSVSFAASRASRWPRGPDALANTTGAEGQFGPELPAWSNAETRRPRPRRHSATQYSDFESEAPESA